MYYDKRYKLFIMHVGVFTGDRDPSDQEMFVVEQKAFKHLCDSLVSPCSCHFSAAPWKLDKSVQVFLLYCERCTRH